MIYISQKDTKTIAKGDTLKSFSKIRTEEMLQTLRTTNENAALLTSELLKISKAKSSGKGVIHHLLFDPDMALDLQQSIHSLEKTSVLSTSTMQQVNKIVTSFNNKGNLISTLNDTIIANKMIRVLSNTENVSIKMEEMVQLINMTIHNANQTIENIKSGKGALNYLSNDPVLVNKIDMTVTHLDSVILQMKDAGILLNQNLEALKYNWFFRSYFDKVEKENQRNKEKK